MFAANPTLVLNADFQPLSYFPLSLFNWEDAVKAVVKGSHVVVAEYDQLIRSPSTVMRLPSVIALRDVCAAAGSSSLHSVQRLPPRSLPLPVLRRPAPPRRTDVRSRHPARGRWPDVLDEHRGGLQPCNTRKDRFHLKPLRKPFEPTQHDLMAAQRLFPPNFLHETWRDYLYWDVELEK